MIFQKHTKFDLCFAISLGAMFFCILLFKDLELATQLFYTKINIAFDFDQAWYIDVITREPSNWLYLQNNVEGTPFSVKHPLAYSYRFLCLPLIVMGLSEVTAAIIVSLSFLSGSLVIVHFLTLKICGDNVTAIFCSLIYALAASTLAISMVLDYYILSSFWICAIALIHVAEVQQNTKIPKVWKVLVYVMAVGTTSYLLILVVVTEMIKLISENVELNSRQKYKELLTLIGQCTFSFLMLFFICYGADSVNILSDPLAAAKKALWAVARPGEKEGFVQILSTFTMFSFIAPVATSVTIENNVTMIDFREWNYTLVGWTACVVLGSNLLFSIYKNNLNITFIYSCIWLLITVLFHLEYQDRGSLFLYTSHVFVFCFLVLLLSFQAQNRTFSRINALSILVLLGMNNVKFFIGFFEV